MVKQTIPEPTVEGMLVRDGGGLLWCLKHRGGDKPLWWWNDDFGFKEWDYVTRHYPITIYVSEQVYLFVDSLDYVTINYALE